jgi:hypothetical protein
VTRSLASATKSKRKRKDGEEEDETKPKAKKAKVEQVKAISWKRKSDGTEQDSAKSVTPPVFEIRDSDSDIELYSS